MFVVNTSQNKVNINDIPNYQKKNAIEQNRF